MMYARVVVAARDAVATTVQFVDQMNCHATSFTCMHLQKPSNPTTNHVNALARTLLVGPGVYARAPGRRQQGIFVSLWSASLLAGSPNVNPGRGPAHSMSPRAGFALACTVVPERLS